MVKVQKVTELRAFTVLSSQKWCGLGIWHPEKTYPGSGSRGQNSTGSVTLAYWYKENIKKNQDQWEKSS